MKALFVREGPSDVYRDFVFRSGAYQLVIHRESAIEVTLSPLQHERPSPETEAIRTRLEEAAGDMDRWFRHLPLRSCPPLEDAADWYFEQLSHPEDGPYWWPMNVSRMFREVDTPIVHLSGWFDCFLDSTLRCFQGIRDQGRTQACRMGQRLVIGPWIHGPTQVGQRAVGELDFGPEATFDLQAYRLRWYDHWLKDTENGIMEGPPVRIFLMGANRWLDLETWPPRVTYQSLFLRVGTGKSDGSLNNGELSFEPPQMDEPADSFGYDPEEPVPSLLTYPELGPRDHRPVEGRMLTYTSATLREDLAVVGPVKAVLYGISSAADTDWVVRLSDVWPDGRSLSVCDGILRARYRDSLSQPELLKSGQVYRFEVDLWATAQVFPAGHRLRVAVTSSDFPRYDRNLNTGEPFGEGAHGQVAVNTIFHDGMRASHLVLPTISQ